MLNIFKKKDSGIKVRDVIWITTEAKWNGLVEMWKKNESTVFIFWFDETLRTAQEYIQQKISGHINLVTAREIHYHSAENLQAIFSEHYPLKTKEQELFQQLHLTEAIVLSALDEPFFKKFGADKIVDMMKTLGMKEDQSIEHNMISGAIKNAQERIEGKVTLEQSARSQTDWVQLNLPD